MTAFKFILAAPLALIILCASASAQVAAPTVNHKPTIFIAVDDSPQSVMLQSEVTGNWLRFSPSGGHELNELDSYAARSMTILQESLRESVNIRFVPLPLEVPIGIHCPAIRLGHGHWEVFPKRAFEMETIPLLTVDWFRRGFQLDTGNANPIRLVPEIRNGHLDFRWNGDWGERESNLTPPWVDFDKVRGVSP